MEPIVVEVTRGSVVEARHVVHAVAVHDGTLELAMGDPGLVTFLRSSAKPIQALPGVRARPDLDDEEIALMCASHLAAPEQLAVVRRLLADAPAREDELECGIDETRIEHNCSGKHAGLLALCRACGWPSDGYRLAGHPCQDAMLAEVAAAAEVDPAAIPTAIDGCGVLTFGLTLERADDGVRAAAAPGGRRAGRSRDAREPRPPAGPGRARRAAHPVARRMVRERRRRGSLVRRLTPTDSRSDSRSSTARSGLSHLRRRTCSARLGVEGEGLGGLEVTSSHGEQVGELRVVQ